MSEVTEVTSVEVKSETTPVVEVTPVAEVVKVREWAAFGKPVAGIVIFQRPRIVNGQEDGWPEFCLAGTDGKPDETFIVLYSGLAVGRARTIGAARNADKAKAKADKMAAKEAANSAPSEVEVLRAELSATKAELATVRSELAAVTAELVTIREELARKANRKGQ